ncbi:MAG: hypothetical protein R3C05_31550 [Pirellulaceae bacterium]
MMSVLEGVVDGDDSVRKAKLERFCEQYTKPLVSFLRFKQQQLQCDAEDLVQEFWLRKMIDRAPHENLVFKYLRWSEQNPKNTFRQYLFRSLINFLRGELRATAKNPRELEIEHLHGFDAGEPEVQDRFDVVWANHILQEILLQTRKDCELKGQTKHWNLFKHHVLPGNEEKQSAVAFEAQARQLGFADLKQARNSLQTVFRKFRRALESRIASDFVHTGTNIHTTAYREEANYLLQVLSRPGGVLIETLDLISPESDIPIDQGSGTSSLSAHGFQGRMEITQAWEWALDQPICDLLVMRQHQPDPRCLTLRKVTRGEGDVDFLQEVRSSAKQLAVSNASDGDSTILEGYPNEFLSVIYLVSVAAARVYFNARISKDSDAILSQRLRRVSGSAWLDADTAVLFQRFNDEISG